MMPVPVIKMGTPGAAIEVGVMDTNTGRIASVMHPSHVTSGVTRLAHTALAFSSTVELPFCSRPAAVAAAAFQPMQSAASGRPEIQPTVAQRSPPTYVVESRARWLTHNDVPVSVMLTNKAAGGSSVTSVDDAASVGGVNTDGSKPVRLNSPASCTTMGRSTPSAAGMAHDSEMTDSQAGCVQGAPAIHTTALSMVACAGGCNPAAVQSAAARRDAGRRSTMRPPPGVSGASPLLPPFATATCDGGSKMMVVFSRCGPPPVPACATHSCVSTGEYAAAGNKKGREHDTVAGDPVARSAHDTLPLAGGPLLGTRYMLALTQLPAPLATTVMVSRHVAVALHAGAASAGGHTTQSTAAPVAYVPAGHGAQAATLPVEYVLAPQGVGDPEPPAQYAPAIHGGHEKNELPLAARL